MPLSFTVLPAYLCLYWIFLENISPIGLHMGKKVVGWLSFLIMIYRGLRVHIQAILPEELIEEDFMV